MKPILPSFGEALVVWARIGCLSFGGPAAQIAMLQREVVYRNQCSQVLALTTT